MKARPPKEENYPDILELMRQAAAKRVEAPPGGHRVPGLWRTLESFAETNPPAAVLASWRHYAGEEYGTVGNFLRATARSAQWYPCLSAAGCGNPHDVVSLEDGRWLARSQEDQRYCPAIWLNEAELAIHELDVERLGVELCRVLGLTSARASQAVTSAPKAWRVGTFTATQSPVYLALCPSEGQLLLNLQSLVTGCGEPFILLAPTARYRSELIGTMLHRERCAFLPLAPCLAPNGAGFRLTSPVRPILDRFAAVCVPHGPTAPEPVIKATPAARPEAGSRGRLRWENDFADIWLGDERYDLRERTKARLCIQYLYDACAFDQRSARHFEKQIDPYVRKHSKLEPLPNYAETKLHHYFNPSRGKLAKLGRELIRSAGRGTGRYFLNVE